MHSIVFLLCLALTICVVTANPLLQALAAQTCPICQPNTYSNQPYALPATIPPYSQVLMTQNPSAPQPVCKNPSPYRPCQKQPLPCPNDQIAPAIVKKLLSNPALKSILDPNTRLYNENGVEVPRNPPCNNGAPNVINNYFIVPPEFFLEDSKCNKEDRRITDDKRVRNRSNEARKRTRQEVTNRQAQETRVPTERRDDKRVKVEGSRDRAIERRRKTRRRPSKNRTADFKVKVLNENSTAEAANQIESPQRQDKKKIKVIIPLESNLTVINEDDSKNKVEEKQNKQTTIVLEVKESTPTPAPNQVVNTTSSLNEEPIRINDEQVRNVVSENINVTEEPTEKDENTEPTPVQVEETTTPLPTVKIETTTPVPTVKIEVNERKNSEKSNPDPPRRQGKPKQRRPTKTNDRGVKMSASRNSKEEAVIQDFLKKFPNIPEELVRNLLDHMKRQIEKEQLGSPAFPYTQFPITYEQLYRNQYSNLNNNPTFTTNARLKKPRRRNHRRRKQRKQKIKNESEFTTVVELTPTIVADVETSTVGTTTSTTTATTEKPFTVEEVTLQPIKVTLAAEFVDEIETTTPKIADNIFEIDSKNEKAENQSSNANDEAEQIEKQIVRVKEEKNPTDLNDKQIRESSEEIDTDYNLNDRIVELGSEDVVPILYENGLVDDYYPDFTNDKQYYSGEDFPIPLIYWEDDRYHYTTDKNYELEELNRERRKYENDVDKDAKNTANRYVFRINGSKGQRAYRRNLFRKRPIPRVRVTSTVKPIILEPATHRSNSEILSKQIDLNTTPKDKDIKKIESEVDNSTENIIPQTIEEIQFRTPPTLEIIDFETKQINKDKYYLNDDKLSTYSDFKTPQYNINEKGDVRTKSRDKNKQLPEIETVFARSKVATYSSPVYKEEPMINEEDFAENDTVSEETPLFSNYDYDDGEKIVVFAKSLPDQFW